ncbi:hypothetical protein ACH5RR_012591 [Cinchona calisaya]|uniref:Uncharacterized protein n=1 Tax=Cinchona calisaya TaxID=153742 RepID=A0ABD3ABK6_9GENT
MYACNIEVVPRQRYWVKFNEAPVNPPAVRKLPGRPKKIFIALQVLGYTKRKTHIHLFGAQNTTSPLTASLNQRFSQLPSSSQLQILYWYQRSLVLLPLPLQPQELDEDKGFLAPQFAKEDCAFLQVSNETLNQLDLNCYTVPFYQLY